MTVGFALGVEAQDLVVTRGGIAVAGPVSFSLRPGDALCLRGDNGTGKSSILRAIAGFSAPAAGSIRFPGAEALGFDLAAVRALATHWLGGEDGLADRLSVAAHRQFWRGLLTTTAAATALAPTSLPDERPAGRLSTGQRRRLGLARLTDTPRPVWLLDEPLSGLDTAARASVQIAIAAHRAAGGVVLMATHEDGLPAAATLRLAAA